MTLQDIAFAARETVLSATGTRLSTGHTYELVAAGLGFNSKAELTAHGSILSLVGVSTRYEDHHDKYMPKQIICQQIEARHRRLKAPGNAVEIGVAMAVYFRSELLFGFRVEDLLAHFEIEHEASSTPHSKGTRRLHLPLSEVDLIDPTRLSLTLEMLESCIPRYAELHHPLASIYSELAHPEADVDPYWYKQSLTGRALEGVEKEWAESYGRFVLHSERAQHHRKAAASAGKARAMVETMQQDGYEPDMDARLRTCMEFVNAGLVAGLALEANAIDAAIYWFKKSALAGDVQSMRWLVEHQQRAPTIETWTFVYLSRLLGDDVTASSMRAYHQDGPYHGQEYDDDLGGGIYVDGDEAIELSHLDSESDSFARTEAQRIHASLT